MRWVASIWPIENVAPRNNFNFSRKSGGLSCEGCNLKTAFSRSCYQISIWKKSPVRRNSVVRSNLAGAEFPDTTYSLKEFQLGSRVRGICFYTVTSFVAIFLFLLMLAVHPFVLLFDRYRRKAHHLIGKIWAKLTVFPFFKAELEGLENLPAPDVSAVYISNHQSFLDIFTLLILGRNFKFISKTAIFPFPVIGWAMYLMGTIRLKRMDSRSQFDCFKPCMNLLGKGASVFFFPEGTRSKDGKLGAFKVGLEGLENLPVSDVPTVYISNHQSFLDIFTLLILGRKFKVGLEGLENLPVSDVPTVYISNHQSFLDIFTLLILGRKFKFISKTAIFLFTIIGWAMHLMGTIRLKRMDSKSQFVWLFLLSFLFNFDAVF
ncbi:hypothetical protein GIB67_010524 [Kingdonia uniflora]|uniref:Phospholipid/glycerol acyltransferase domain-containing protein n=1 Tax=Kingdonia uniflora TaxID=39325 RepID=A0A7J7MB01_9MAGN|nr:hypothetical protein GIB67_010524 [Kingdonia uniflora]